MGISTKAFMIQGVGTNVGKSLLVAGLCRLAHRRGLKVAPFKPQNMSNNAAVTMDGGEIGRAQALQAKAAGLSPTRDMNPVLLKPESEAGSQVIVLGERFGRVQGKAYRDLKPKLLPKVLAAFTRLVSTHDLVIVEGAGSAAEVNLQASDFANMGFAEAANLPVILVGDIDRGGVIASLIGTWTVLAKEHRERIQGFLINKFRGDASLFADAQVMIEGKTGWKNFGLIPHFEGARDLPAEDSVDLARQSDDKNSKKTIRIGVLQYPRIANFDDLDPLRLEPDVEVKCFQPGEVLDAGLDLIILPGSKSVCADLAILRDSGWDIDLQAHIRRGGLVLGLCGGYQMLGTTIVDALGIEGDAGEVPGLGLLKTRTELQPQKALKRVSGTSLRDGLQGFPIQGYEIHIGVTTGEDCTRPLFNYEDARPEGAVDVSGQVMGTYWHGLFAEDKFRHAFLNLFRLRNVSLKNYNELVEKRLDALADLIEANMPSSILAHYLTAPQQKVIE